MRKIFGFIIALIMLFSLIEIVMAIEEEEENHEEIFAQAEEIIKQRIPCSELTEGQMENLGDYFMEQMHPGELHEIMDERMGGEGSESLRQVHVNMGLMFYCGQRGAMSSGMMNMMMGRTGIAQGGMMGYGNGFGMMNNFPITQNAQNYSGSNWFGWVWLIFAVLIFVILILIIILLIKKLPKK